MLKTAKFKSEVFKKALGSPELKAAIKGGLKHGLPWGTGTGALVYSLERSKNPRTKKPYSSKKKALKSAFKAGLSTGAVMGLHGASQAYLNEAFKSSFRGDAKARNWYRSRQRSAPRPPKPEDLKVPDWLKDVKSKAEAKTKFRAQARTHHPDFGGSEEKMKKVNTDWDNFQKHHFDKLAFLLPSFMEELMRIREASR